VISSIPVQYFRWLYDRVCDVRDSQSYRSYQEVCDEMQRMKFKVIVPGDENRRSNGADLRDEFLDFIRNRDLDRQAEREAHQVSLFETLVSLSDEARLMTGESCVVWFSIFLQNTGLDHYPDVKMDVTAKLKVRRILRRLNDRKYGASGKGGLFPLNMPLQDQRDVELWLQMGAYVRENYI
jgi:hypothetical protein